MRLAFITSSFPPYASGVAVNALDITARLASKGYQVGVFIPTYPEPITLKSSLTNPNLHIFRLPSFKNPLKSSHLVFSPLGGRLLSQLTSFRPNVIHLQDPEFFLFPAIKKFASKNHIPIVCAHHFPPEFVTNQFPFWLRTNVINRLIIGEVINLYSQSDLVITPTETMKKLLERNGLKTPVNVISCGVDRNKYTPPTQSSSHHRSNVILYLGRLDFDKNLDILIRAFGHLKSKSEIWLAGSGKAENFLKSLTSKLKLNDRIKFIGYVPEDKKVEIYQQAKVFVQPSTAEAQSIASLEAASCGLPLILANSQALPELINPEHPNGVLFKPNDPVDLASRIDALLSNQKELKMMGINSRRATAAHDINKAINTYEQTYLSLISKSNSIIGWQSWSDTRRSTGSYPRRYFSPFGNVDPIRYQLPSSKIQRNKAPTGWCSWHCFGSDINEQTILDQAKIAAKLNLEYILIDDGWTTWGDWLLMDKDRFPHGLKWLVKKLKTYGLKTGLWWSPLLAKTSSKLFRDHPKWFVQNLEGTQVSPLDCLLPDKRRVLNSEDPFVAGYLDQCLDHFVDCGIGLLKSDFLYAFHFNPKFTSPQIPDTLLRRLLSTIIQRNFYSIACGCPLTPAIGVVDAIRISEDINIPALNHVWPLNRLIIQQRISQLSANIKSRLPTQSFWRLDPDAFISSSKLGVTHSQAKKLSLLINECNGVIFLGDDLTSLTPFQLTLINQLTT